MTHSKFEKITKDDLRIFPPHTLFFVLTLLLTTLSAGIGTFTIWNYLDLSVYVLLSAIAAFSLIYNAFFMLAVRGHPIGFKLLRSATYIFIFACILGFIVSIGDANTNAFGITGVLLGVLASRMIASERYTIFYSFVTKRWARYRETGVPLLDQYKLQQAQEAVDENRK
jgi:hypothetical protein